MLRITRYIYIHFLTPVLFAVCIFYGKAFELTSSYFAMTLHELAHTAAALAIGLRVSHITFFPFGVNLKLKNKLVASLADEIILYASGPFINVLLSVFAAVLYKFFPIYEIKYIYILNTALFSVNLLPALPLDGGIILKKILVHKFGSGPAVNILRFFSAVTALFLLILGAYAIYATEFNFSVLLLVILISGNIFTQKEKYNLDYIKELMFYTNKSKKRAAVKAADASASAREIIKSFDFGKYNIVFLIDENGKIKKTLTETEIVNKALNIK